MKIIVNDDIYITSLKKEDVSVLFSFFKEEKEILKNIFDFVNDNMNKEEKEFFSLSSQEYQFVIWYKNMICGYLELYDVKNHIAEGLYYLNKNYRGLGITKKSVIALIDHAFNELSINQINFLINIDNIDSINLVESIGIKKKDLLLKNDYCNHVYHDQYLYSISKDEWNN